MDAALKRHFVRRSHRSDFLAVFIYLQSGALCSIRCGEVVQKSFQINILIGIIVWGKNIPMSNLCIVRPLKVRNGNKNVCGDAIWHPM